MICFPLYIYYESLKRFAAIRIASNNMRGFTVFAAGLLVTCSLIRIMFEELPFNTVASSDGCRPDVSSNATTLQLRGTLTKKEFPDQCQDMVSRFHNTTTNRKPVIVAGYPGSGNTVTHALIRKLTGFNSEGFDDPEACNSRRVVTCKTHYPVYYYRQPDLLREEVAPTALLLIRNPADALPSHFNVIWEGNNNVSSHSTQGAEEDWIIWRDENFDKEVELWYQLLKYWFKEWYVQTVLPYERLTHSEYGPPNLEQLVRHLESSGFPVATDFECQWYQTVIRLAENKREPRRYTPKYTTVQKMKLLEVINRIMTDLEGHSVMTPILSQYIKDISQSVDLVQ